MPKIFLIELKIKIMEIKDTSTNQQMSGLPDFLEDSCSSTRIQHLQLPEVTDLKIGEWPLSRDPQSSKGSNFKISTSSTDLMRGQNLLRIGEALSSKGLSIAPKMLMTFPPKTFFTDLLLGIRAIRVLKSGKKT